ncbi:MAG TPA: phosphoglycerate dehydrogenase [Candidatus Acidoferrales bacterium]|nr:phosphoglycerate dehydrogenase [Candidatus Acidoferrales bacterium]
MKIVIAENISARAAAIFQDADPSWEIVNLTQSKIPVADAVADAEALLIRTATRVTPALLARAEKLRVIGRAGVGVDNVDLGAATRRGVVVMNTPGGNSISVAEHTFAFLTCLARHILPANASLKQGLWEKKKFTGVELRGKTLGIIGLGRVGSAVARLALAYEMETLAYDPYVSPRAAGELGVRLAGFAELLRTSDFVTLHCSLTEETRRMINAKALALAKPGMRLVNCSRGEVVDPEALVAALDSGRVAAAAIDVFDPEPPGLAPLVCHPRVIATPHIAGSTEEAQEAIGVAIAEQVRDYLLAGAARNAVNLPALSADEQRRIEPYLELGERLGSFLAQISGEHAEEVRISYDGALSQLDTNLVKNAVLMGILRRSVPERVNLINAGAVALDRGLEVIEQRSVRRAAFSNSLGVALRAETGTNSALGMAAPRGGQWILGVNDIDVEAPLRGSILVLRNQDVPGVIGRIGTVLGNRNINIANFALGRSPETGEALGLVNVDQWISAEDLEEIRAIPAIRFAKVVEVGPARKE